jgi:hypothetical protein
MIYVANEGEGVWGESSPRIWEFFLLKTTFQQTEFGVLSNSNESPSERKKKPPAIDICGIIRKRNSQHNTV